MPTRRRISRSVDFATVKPVHRHRSGRVAADAEHAVQVQHQRGLARAVRPEDGDALAPGHRQVHPEQHLPAVRIGERQIPDVEHGVAPVQCRGPRRRRPRPSQAALDPRRAHEVATIAPVHTSAASSGATSARVQLAAVPRDAPTASRPSRRRSRGPAWRRRPARRARRTARTARRRSSRRPAACRSTAGRRRGRCRAIRMRRRSSRSTSPYRIMNVAMPTISAAASAAARARAAARGPWWWRSAATSPARRACP